MGRYDPGLTGRQAILSRAPILIHQSARERRIMVDLFIVRHRVVLLFWPFLLGDFLGRLSFVESAGPVIIGPLNARENKRDKKFGCL